MSHDLSRLSQSTLSPSSKARLAALADDLQPSASPLTSAQIPRHRALKLGEPPPRNLTAPRSWVATPLAEAADLLDRPPSASVPAPTPGKRDLLPRTPPPPPRSAAQTLKKRAASLLAVADESTDEPLLHLSLIHI